MPDNETLQSPHDTAKQSLLCQKACCCCHYSTEDCQAWCNIVEMLYNKKSSFSFPEGGRPDLPSNVQLGCHAS